MAQETWLIKDSKSRIQGPFNESEICSMIQNQSITEEFFISLYPYGDWKPISLVKNFHDEILKSLNQKKPAPEKEEKIEKQHVEATVVIPHPQLKKKKPKKKKILFPSLLKEPEDSWDEESEIIEMDELEETPRSLSFGQILVGTAVVGAVLLAGFFYINPSSKTSTSFKAVHLLRPKNKSQTLPISVLKKKYKQHFFHLNRSNVRHYIKSQQILISILEGNRNELEAYSQLCLIHLELWPFAFQDSQDHNAINKLQDMINKIDKGGIHSGFCTAADYFIKGEYKKSLLLTESSLQALGDHPSLFFYYLKSRIFHIQKDYDLAEIYLKPLTSQVPQWIAPHLLRAEIFYQKKRFEKAARIYKHVLSVYPEHSEARLRLADIEFNVFKKVRRAQTRIQAVLKEKTHFINPDILTKAYLNLAYVAKQDNDLKTAQKLAERAYQLDPHKHDIIQFLSQLGQKNLDHLPIKSRQLVYKGDVLFQSGDCDSASEYYRKAFQASQKGNALAAVGMAKCLWKENSSQQAMAWLQKAITSDPKMMEAYFLLSKYLSKKYEFHKARSVLNSARRYQPNSYEIFKGQAFLAFEEENYQLAANYAKKAISFYTSDAEVYVILSRSQRALGQVKESYDNSLRAIEENVNSSSAQINRARAAADFLGFSHGLQFFQSLTQEFPDDPDYEQAFGEFYFDYEKYKEAASVFLKRVSKDSKDILAHIYLGRIFARLGHYHQSSSELEEAVRYFYKALALDPSRIEIYFYLSELYIKQNNYDEAISLLKKISIINKNYPLINYHLARVMYLSQKRSQLQKAKQFIEIEKRKNPLLSRIYALSGDIYKSLAEKSSNSKNQKIKAEVTRNYEICATEYQQALKLKPKDLDYSVQLLICYVKSGDLDLALDTADQFVKAGEKNSGYAEFYKIAGEIYLLKGDYQLAGEKYQQYFKLFPAVDQGFKNKIKKELAPYYNLQ